MRCCFISFLSFLYRPPVSAAAGSSGGAAPAPPEIPTGADSESRRRQRSRNGAPRRARSEPAKSRLGKRQRYTDKDDEKVLKILSDVVLSIMPDWDGSLDNIPHGCLAATQRLVRQHPGFDRFKIQSLSRIVKRYQCEKPQLRQGKGKGGGRKISDNFEAHVLKKLLLVVKVKEGPTGDEVVSDSISTNLFVCSFGA